MRQGKRKKRGGEKGKSKSQDCCVTFKPKNIKTSQGILGIDLAITKPLQQTNGQSYDYGNAVANIIIKRFIV